MVDEIEEGQGELELETEGDVEETEGEEEQVEGEGEEAEAEGEEPEARSPPRSRATERILKFRDEVRAERQRADDLQRQLTQLQYERQSYQQQNDAALEQQRLAEMDPEQRVEYMLQRARQEQQQFMQAQQFSMQDVGDATDFKSLCREVPEFAKLAPQVEHELSVIRRQYGWNAPRRLVLATLLGLQVMNSRNSLPAARAAGQKRIQGQRTKPPGGGGSDVPRRAAKPDPNSPAARRARLEDVVF